MLSSEMMAYRCSISITGMGYILMPREVARLLKRIDREVCIIRDGPSQSRRPGFNQSYRKSNTPHIRGNSGYHQNTMNTRDSWEKHRSSQRHPMLDIYGAEAVRDSRFMSRDAGSSSWNTPHNRRPYI